MKTKIVGHRGAAGLALENTRAAFKAGMASGCDALEFDVRLTKDKQLVVFHDGDLLRLAGDPRLVSQLTLAELQKITLSNGENIPSLSEVLQMVGTMPVIIELKDEHTARPVLRQLENFPAARATIASFRHAELALIKTIRPAMPVFVATRTDPFEIIHIARAIGADGLDMNFWLLNPLSYLWARRNKLTIMVYTVNNWFLARFIHIFYPSVLLCTNYPDNFKRRLRRKH